VVQFILANDSKKVFSFCSLQSQAAQPLIAACGIPAEEVMNSFVLVQRKAGYIPPAPGTNDQFTFYRASTAALQIGCRLDRPFSLLAPVALWIPASLRDAVYYCVARNRYFVFGKSDLCMVPTKALKQRFLDLDEMHQNQAKEAAAEGPHSESAVPTAKRSPRARSSPRK
jgi:predicted DCC family thiol-disulfide oxidoreductase YuxK